ncbi:MAG: lipopolysaccharide biosynthesis protein [Nocardioidaceae bacterium]
MSRWDRVRPALGGASVIAVAMGVMNVTTYGFTIIAARVLGPEEYGALAAVMGLLLVVNVVSLGLQATAARRVSSSPGSLQEIEHQVLSTSARSALALGLLCLVLAPVLNSELNLRSLGATVLIAVTVVPLTIMGGQSGLLQGERRWVPLALIYLTVGVGRVAFGVIALAFSQTMASAMVGVAIGAVLPAVVGWFALRHPSRLAGRVPMAKPARASWARGGVLRETAHNSHALLAFFALSNTDVLIARRMLPEHQAGLYAAGLILAKAVLFLPQFVVVMVFPAMSQRPHARRMNLLSLATVLVIGACVVAGVLVLAPIAVEFVGGSQYSALQSRLWLFAVIGTLLAMIQLLVYSVVARQHQHAVYVIWAALVVLIGLAPVVSSVSFLIGCVIAIDSTLFLVLLALSLRPARATAGHEAPTDSADLPAR